MIGTLLLLGIAKNRLGDAVKFNRLSRFIRVMAEYILAILRSQLMVVFSWGFRRPSALPDDRGLAFEVNGFLYKGRVEVIYNDALDLFEVRLADGRVEEMVYCDNLVAVIEVWSSGATTTKNGYRRSIVIPLNTYQKGILNEYTKLIGQIWQRQ